jgi:hypothetical protein
MESGVSGKVGAVAVAEAKALDIRLADAMLKVAKDWMPDNCYEYYERERLWSNLRDRFQLAATRILNAEGR